MGSKVGVCASSGVVETVVLDAEGRDVVGNGGGLVVGLLEVTGESSTAEVDGLFRVDEMCATDGGDVRAGSGECGLEEGGVGSVVGLAVASADTTCLSVYLYDLE